MAFDASKNLIPVPLHIYTRITSPAPRALKIPKCRNGGFNRVRLRNVTYLTFCFEMEKLNRPLVIDRREMEIAWATFLLKFFRLWEGDEQARIRKGKRLEEGEPTWRDQWEALKTAFKDVSVSSPIFCCEGAGGDADGVEGRSVVVGASDLVDGGVGNVNRKDETAG